MYKSLYKSNLFLFFLFLAFAPNLTAQYSFKEHTELGAINWMRSLDEAKLKAAEVEKPILILFQEVPGCATCRNYGQDALSHPLLVEAIQSLFIPVAIFNNKGGKDKTTLATFKEPSWNNPVVRVINHEMNEMAPRLGSNYSKIGLLNTMIRSLINNKMQVPDYLYTLEEEFQAEKSRTKTKTYSMYCFWTGEKAFGQVEGVVKTEAGWKHGKEVVDVTFDTEVIDEVELDIYAKKNSCSAMLKPGKFTQDKDPKYYLSKSEYRYIPMTELQKSRVNAAIGDGRSPNEYLSPNQLAYFNKIKNKEVEGEDLILERDFEYAYNYFIKS